jgi:AcrR family transcriptional regulator
VITKESARRLDPEKVVDSALAIADDEGTAAVTFRRLAAQHDVTPMALYRHFKDKDDLLAALGDHLLADVVLPEPTDERWDQQLQKVLTAFVTALRGHPRLADLTLSRILVSEPGLVMAERTLQLLVEGGFSVDDAAEVGRQSICSLIALVTTDPMAREVSEPIAREDSLRRKRASLAALPPRNYPLIAASADTLICPPSTDRYYALGIDMTVAGIRGVLNKE